MHVECSSSANTMSGISSDFPRCANVLPEDLNSGVIFPFLTNVLMVSLVLQAELGTCLSYILNHALYFYKLSFIANSNVKQNFLMFCANLKRMNTSVSELQCPGSVAQSALSWVEPSSSTSEKIP